MFPQFGATADSLSKASTMVFRIGTDAHLYDDPEDVNIAPLLDSKFDSEKCEALKRLLALIAQGIDVSNFFPQVVKNVASRSLEVKKLAYLYLLHYAEKRPNEALLSINCFQKDLGDTNPLVRAWALRTMAGIRLHVIAPLVLLSVSKCARDPSVYVRKCTANALPKLNDLRQEENASAIEEIVGILLNDNSPGVVGAAAAAFNSICPNNLSLIGRHYRRLCEILPDVEEWGQIVLIGILLRYLIARHGLVKESMMFSSCSTINDTFKTEASGINTTPQKSDDLGDEISNSEVTKVITRSYIEGPDEYLSRSSYTNGVYHGLDDASFTSAESNDNVKILLKCTSPLLWSHNSAVVLAAAGVHWIVAPKDDIEKIVKPVLFVLRSSTASQYVVLCNIQVFAKAVPSLFASYYEDFFISISDTYQIKALKLEILSHIATDSSIPYIFQEFQDYIKDPDRRFAADAVAAIGLCARRLPKVANVCLQGLLSLTRQEALVRNANDGDEEAVVLIQAIMSIKEIIKRDPQSHEKVIIRLIQSLDFIKVPSVRAIIIWMVGEYNSQGEIIQKTVTTVLKYLAYCFTSEASETKLQILNASAKVLLRAEGEVLRMIAKVVSFVIELAKCDSNYDIRDRARVLDKLLAGLFGSQDQDEISTLKSKDLAHVARNIFWGQINPMYLEPIKHRIYLPGSLSQIVLHSAPGYEPLPKPGSLISADQGQHPIVDQRDEVSKNLYATNDSDTSGSIDGEGSSICSSQHSITGSSLSDGSEGSGSESEADEKADLLVRLSDDGDTYNSPALESGSTNLSSSQSAVAESSRVIDIHDMSSRVKPKSYTLLDSASGNGLKVDYSFTSRISEISPLLVCVEVSFQNCSTEPFSEVILVDEEFNNDAYSTEPPSVARERFSASQRDVPILVPMEEIDLLEPGQTTKRILEIRFFHHLLPIKLVLCCNGRKHSVKMRPDIGYFVKPLEMDAEAFRNKEALLPGMFEYVRSCTFTDHIAKLNDGNKTGDISPMREASVVICESLALKMLSNANVFLVSVDLPPAAEVDGVAGLCLRFSSEILSTSVPCLITIAVEGRCLEPLTVSVKVNCEETVFGLNLLNRVVNFLVESSS
ncbi:hypothetical protein Nepgr_032432 [Nepenthes gracilis]|uniref:AP-3 complex subunit beta n=1 Tax=Nepenthes gracilis TaxID=150966 RepID=A0AAD3TK30_NEPGR|nr:hypothetical protein Nepgr_032432 [Nepenthes gracilis]